MLTASEPHTGVTFQGPGRVAIAPWHVLTLARSVAPARASWPQPPRKVTSKGHHSKATTRQFAIATAVACTVALRGVPQAMATELHDRDPLPIVQLAGTPNELGRRHGELLGDTIGKSVSRVVDYFRTYFKIPVVGAWAANWWLDRSWAQSWPYIPTDYVEELQTLSDGASVPLKDLWRMHAIPDRTYACANFAAWGEATAEGRLIHARNLDWNIDAGIQRYPIVYVVRPTGKLAYVNIGWAGFTGVLTGINERQISIGQVGAETADVSFAGLPMAFLMRRVLEQAQSLDEAITIILESPRTVGVNYIVADAKARRAVAIETTHSFAKVFEADDPKERDVAYARPIRDAVFRADTAVDPVIRNEQLASGGNPKTIGLEPPTGSAYEVRYLGQAKGLAERHGRLNVDGAQALTRSIAPDSNVQSVIFAWPEVFIANAVGTTPAAQTTYHRLNLEDLLKPGGPNAPVSDAARRGAVPSADGRLD